MSKRYSSMPLQGASGAQTQAIVNGMKLALEQAGNKAGAHPIKYVSLDNSTAQAGSWTPEATSANARKAAADGSTAVYLGEFNSGAAAVSIPILNSAGVPMISPANTAVGLTTKEPGATPGEPEKYYPAGKRNYTRIVARDSIKGPVMVQVMKDDGCTKVALTNDKEVYGAGLAAIVAAAKKTKGGIPATVAARFQCTSPTLPKSELPPSGQEFFTAYAQKFGGQEPDPYSIYGYEAMRLAIDAIKRSGTGDKADVIKALFATKNRQSPLGTYSIDKNGDTTLTDMAIDTVKDGQLKFEKVVKGVQP